MCKMSIFSPVQQSFHARNGHQYDKSARDFDCYESSVLKTPFQGYSESPSATDFTNLQVRLLLYNVQYCLKWVTGTLYELVKNI